MRKFKLLKLNLMHPQQFPYLLATLALMGTSLVLLMIAGNCCCSCLKRSCLMCLEKLISVLMCLRIWDLLFQILIPVLFPPHPPPPPCVTKTNHKVTTMWYLYYLFGIGAF
ncbi:hypothetical protein CFP56_043078 [Quercus suber]|uniref:Uncharacterized protein n=1 Tax=Quercus suber TaxID=58331 RepID=A0AAW0LJI5_QUESU